MKRDSVKRDSMKRGSMKHDSSMENGGFTLIETVAAMAVMTLAAAGLMTAAAAGAGTLTAGRWMSRAFYDLELRQAEGEGEPDGAGLEISFTIEDIDGDRQVSEVFSRYRLEAEWEKLKTELLYYSHGEG